MADILALGITHYPPLSGPDERMSWILRRMLENPSLPESLRSPEGWPPAMREEWGYDQGTASATEHRKQLVAWMRKVRKTLDEFNPDFVLIWGDDQYENFKEDIIPPYCVLGYPSFEFNPRSSDNVWGEPADHLFKLQGHQQAAKFLTTELIDSGFDASYAYKPLHHPLGHAFANAIHYLDYDREGFDYPILPVSINCYGRHVVAQRGGLRNFEQKLSDTDLDPPAPSPRRLFDLGAETARILQKSPWRVAILASSGWSHAFLVEKNHHLWPDTAADRKLYDDLRAGNYSSWREYPASAIEESGQQEVLNWMCLAGALDHLGRVPTETEFIDTWIFNSTKAFLISPPSSGA